MSDNISPTYCSLPWSHLYVGPDGKIAPCCIGKNIGTYGKITLEKAWNSEEMKKLRLDMISGVRNDLCDSCYKNEDMGFKSMRYTIMHNDMFDVKKSVAETNVDGSLNDFKLSYLDIRFNNLCNFKCRTCNSYFSSSIAVETIQHPGINAIRIPISKSFKQNNDIMSEVEKHYPHVRSIYFAGGEPMMQEEHWNILKHLVDSGSAKNVSLIYATNMSRLSFKNQSIFDYWKHFKHVNIHMSIDAEGNRAEYWRDGTVWEEVFNNIKVTKNIHSIHSIHSGIHSVISWVTIYSYIELIKKMINEFTSHRHDFTIWCLDAPEEYSLQILPDFKKEEIKKALDDFIEYLQNIDKTNYPEVINIINNIENIKIFMYAKSTVITKKTFKKHFMLDKIRNKDFFEYFPEHENMKEYMQ